MVWLIVLIIVILCILSLNFRLILFNLPLVVYYGVTDLWNWYVLREKDRAPYGILEMFTALFGKGKTLSAVGRLMQIYFRYNGKKVWDKERKKFVTQRIHIISNVDIRVLPFEWLTNLSQVVKAPELAKVYDEENDTLTYIFVLIDELSVQLNSREFKKNINAQFLNSLLCCRHYRMSLIGTTQRFKHADALVRQVTQNVIECDKLWRLQRQYVYDAYELENASNPREISPLYKTGFFVTDKYYNAYDTYAVVDNLIKAWENGDMITDEEILALQSNNDINIGIEEPKKKLFGFKKKKKK